MSDRLALANAIEDASAQDARFARQDVAFARQDVAIEQLRSGLRELESRITLRLGGIVVAAVAVIVGLQHLWPSH
jgi:hypothetical protein